MKIEDIIFRPMGEYPFKYEEVTGLKPETNVHGLTLIQGKYYKKVII